MKYGKEVYAKKNAEMYQISLQIEDIKYMPLRLVKIHQSKQRQKRT